MFSNKDEKCEGPLKIVKRQMQGFVVFVD